MKISGFWKNLTSKKVNMRILRKLGKREKNANRGLTQTELKKELDQTRQYIHEAVKELERLGILEVKEKRSGEEGGRVKIYGLTDTGRYLYYTMDLNRAKKIKETISELRFKLRRDPTLEEIIKRMKKSPENQELRDLIYEVGRTMEKTWEKPTEEGRETAKSELKRVLIRAAWLRNELNFVKEKNKWKRNDIKTVRFEGGKRNWAADSSLTEEAKKYSEKYLNLIPPVYVEKGEDEWVYGFHWTAVSDEFGDEDLEEIQKELREISTSSGVFESADGDVVLKSKTPIGIRELEALFQKMKEPLQEELYVDKIRKIGERGSPYPKDYGAFRYLLGKLKDIFWNSEEKLENQKHRLHLFETIVGLPFRNRKRRKIAEELGYLNLAIEEEYADFFLKVISISKAEWPRKAWEIEDMKRESFRKLALLPNKGRKRIRQILNQFVSLPNEEAQAYTTCVLKGLRRLSSEVEEEMMREKLKETYNSAETSEKKEYIREWLNDKRIFG